MTTDAKDNPTDAVPEKGGDSKDKGRQDSAPPKTYTEDEVERKFSEQRSVLDKKVTGLEKTIASANSALEVANKRAEAADTRDAERQKTRDVKDLEDAKDNPELLSAVKLRQEARTQMAEARKEREETQRERVNNQTRIDAADATELEGHIFEIAKKHEVNPMQLKNLGISDMKQIEKIAEAISTKKPFIPDSGKTTGGTQMPETSGAKIKAGWDALHPTK